MCRSSKDGGRRCEGHGTNSPRFKATRARVDYALQNSTINELHSPVDPSVGLPKKPFSVGRKKVKGSPVDIIHTYTPGEYSIEQVREAAVLVDKLYAAEGEELEKLGSIASDLYGSPLQAIQFVGVQITGRAEEYAGITGSELKDAVQKRKEELNQEAVLNVLNLKIVEGQEIWRQRLQNGELAGLSVDEYSNQYYQFMGEFTKAEQDAVSNVETELKAIVQKGQKQLADGYRKALNDVRDVGGKISFTELSDAAAVKVATEAVQIYPTSWIELAEKEGDLTVIEIPDRAHYSHENFVVNNKATPPTIVKSRNNLEEFENPFLVYTPVEKASRSGLLRMRKYASQEYEFVETGNITDRPFGPDWEFYRHTHSEGQTVQGWRRPKRLTVEGAGLIVNMHPSKVADTSNGYAVAVHELGHRMERVVPGLARMEQHWIMERTTVKNQREPLVQLDGGRDDEYVRQDSFINSYIGKEYAENSWHHEAFTVGVQALFGGDFGGLVGVEYDDTAYNADEDMRTFILGVMGSAGFSQNSKDKKPSPKL